MLGRFDPEVDIIGHVVRPMHLDDNVAGRLVIFGLGFRLVNVRQQHYHHRDKADQRQQNHISERRPGCIVVEFAKWFLHALAPDAATAEDGARALLRSTISPRRRTAPSLTILMLMLSQILRTAPSS